MSIRGIITKHESGTMVFCPDLAIDLRLGIPNQDWIQDNGCYITNQSEYPNLKEGDEVLVDPIYNSWIPRKELNPLGLWCNCKIIKLEQ